MSSLRIPVPQFAERINRCEPLGWQWLKATPKNKKICHHVWLSFEEPKRRYENLSGFVSLRWKSIWSKFVYHFKKKKTRGADDERITSLNFCSFCVNVPTLLHPYCLRNLTRAKLTALSDGTIRKKFGKWLLFASEGAVAANDSWKMELNANQIQHQF